MFCKRVPVVVTNGNVLLHLQTNVTHVISSVFEKHHCRRLRSVAIDNVMAAVGRPIQQEFRLVIPEHELASIQRVSDLVEYLHERVTHNAA